MCASPSMDHVRYVFMDYLSGMFILKINNSEFIMRFEYAFEARTI